MFTHSFWKTVLWFTPWTIHWVVYETQNKPTFTNIGILIRSFSFGWLEHVGTPIISEIHIQPHFLDNWTNFVGDPAGIAPNDLFPIPRTLSEWPVLGKKQPFECNQGCMLWAFASFLARSWMACWSWFSTWVNKYDLGGLSPNWIRNSPITISFCQIWLMGRFTIRFWNMITVGLHHTGPQNRQRKKGIGNLINS